MLAKNLTSSLLLVTPGRNLHSFIRFIHKNVSLTQRMRTLKISTRSWIFSLPSRSPPPRKPSADLEVCHVNLYITGSLSINSVNSDGKTSPIMQTSTLPSWIYQPNLSTKPLPRIILRRLDSFLPPWRLTTLHKGSLTIPIQTATGTTTQAGAEARVTTD